MDKFLDLTGLTEYDQLIKNYVDNKSGSNAFDSVTINSTTISATATNKNLNLVAGDNITITPDADTNGITISSSGSSNGINQNLLDNPFFTVNQRGQSIYETVEQYCFDRWVLQNVSGNAKIDTIDINNILITTQNNDGLKQCIGESNKMKNGEMYTISFSDGITIYSKTFKYDSSNNIVQKYDDTKDVSFAVINNDNKIFIYPYVRYDGLKTETIYSVKLENGTASTLAMDTVPDYEEERLKCSISKADPADTYSNKDLIHEYNLLKKYIDIEDGKNWSAFDGISSTHRTRIQVDGSTKLGYLFQNDIGTDIWKAEILTTYHNTDNGVDVLDYATNMPNNHQVVRIYSSPTSPYGAVDNDFWYDILKLDSNWIRIIAYDVRTLNTYVINKNNNTWLEWKQVSTSQTIYSDTEPSVVYTGSVWIGS